MFSNYILDRVALERDPNLIKMHFDPGAQVSVFETPEGKLAFDLITSRVGLALLVGAVCSAPSRPPVVAIEPLLVEKLGNSVFEDGMKRLVGRIVRFTLEHVGARYGERGIKVSSSVESNFKSGSTYLLPNAVNF